MCSENVLRSLISFLERLQRSGDVILYFSGEEDDVGGDADDDTFVKVVPFFLFVFEVLLEGLGGVSAVQFL